ASLPHLSRLSSHARVLPSFPTRRSSDLDRHTNLDTLFGAPRLDRHGVAATDEGLDRLGERDGHTVLILVLDARLGEHLPAAARGVVGRRELFTPRGKVYLQRPNEDLLSCHLSFSFRRALSGGRVFDRDAFSALPHRLVRDRDRDRYGLPARYQPPGDSHRVCGAVIGDRFHVQPPGRDFSPNTCHTDSENGQSVSGSVSSFAPPVWMNEPTISSRSSPSGVVTHTSWRRHWCNRAATCPSTYPASHGSAPKDLMSSRWSPVGM